MKVKELLAKLSECEDLESEILLQKDENSRSVSIKAVAINNVKRRVRLIGEELPAWTPIKL